jgi:nucleotide-binding universal stress UspA family protein
MVQQPMLGEGRFVLAPIAADGDDLAGLRQAAAVARRLGLPLLLMSVLPAHEPPPFGGGAPVAPAVTPTQDRVRDRLRTLRQTAAALGGDLHAEVYACIDDDPAKAICARAEEGDTALIVLGTHARTGLARLFRGSVAEATARRARTPVLVVPQAD